MEGSGLQGRLTHRTGQRSSPASSGSLALERGKEPRSHKVVTEPAVGAGGGPQPTAALLGHQQMAQGRMPRKFTEYDLEA